MFYTRCLYCDEEVILEDTFCNREVKCPVCKHFFDAIPMDAPVGMVLAQARQQQWQVVASLATQLVSHHLCSQCDEPIASATGQRRCTISCPHCYRKTSLYSVLFKCPRCADFLECPERETGSRRKCPACAETIVIPFQLLRLAPDNARGDSAILVRCPNHECNLALETESENVGKSAVCPACSVVFTIPRHGQAPQLYVPPTQQKYGAQEAISRSRMIRCPRCELPMPSKADSCPHCS